MEMFRKIKSLMCCLVKSLTSISFETNKIIGSILLAGLIALSGGYAAKAIYKPELHPEKRGFQIEVAENTASNSAAPAAQDKAPDVLKLIATADAAKGAEVAKKCLACHSVEKGGANKVGPNLWGVVNATAGGHSAGYAYSTAMVDKGKGGAKWTYEELQNFLYAPSKYVKGTKMTFAGLKKPEELAGVIAYLRTQSDSPAPLP